jgi:superfamily I DNA/RNA helicase
VIVGDENQSIYSFKHAHPEGIVEWELENDAKTDHELTECYRSPERVVSIANSLIAHNPDGNRHPLQARPENGEGIVTIVQFAGIDEEATGIASDIVQRLALGTPPGDIIVLSPRKKLGLKISTLLREAGVPCRDYLSESELEAKEVTERLALLMIACNRDDRPALRWLLGYGSNDFRANQYAKLRNACVEHCLSPWDALVLSENGGLVLKQCGTLKDRFRAIRQSVEIILDQGDAVVTLNYLFPPAEDNSARIRELFISEVTAETSLEDVRKLLLEKIYEPNFPNNVEYVRIMTLYGSKGLGSPIVYITSLVDGLLPRFSDEDDDAETLERKRQEQRRLFYVAVTRVKAVPALGKAGELHLSSFRFFDWAEAHNLNNGNSNAQASRFLSELGPRAPAPIKG